jgi:hypothetical protein
MPRKFCLSVHRKNQERKKKNNGSQVKSLIIVVSFALTHYKSAKATTLSVLHNRISTLNVVPEGNNSLYIIYFVTVSDNYC